MSQRKPSFPKSEPPRGFQLFASILLLVVPLGAFVFGILHPPRTASVRTIFNILTAFMAGAAGYFWGGVVLRVEGTRNGLKIAIRALGAVALLLIVYFNPPFKDSPVPSTQIHLQRICGLDVVRASKPLAVDPVCTVDGQIRGAVEPGSELCIEVKRSGAQTEQTCTPVSAGPFHIGGVAIRETGSPTATNAEIFAELFLDEEPVESAALPAAIPVATRAPEARIDGASAVGGFTVRGTSAGLLDDEQLVIRVEDAENTRAGAAYLYAEGNGAAWTAHDRGDAKVPPAHAYRLTLFIGPRNETSRSFRDLPERSREIGTASIVKSDEPAKKFSRLANKALISGGTL